MTIAADPFNDIEPDLASELADYASKEEGGCGITEMLTSTGISKLEKDTPLDQISVALRNLSNELKKGDRLQVAVIREAAKRKLTEIGIQSPAALIDAALAVNQASRQSDVSFVELLPWPDPIAGNDLLEDIASMFCRYVILSSQDATALVLWTILTYLTDAVYILPLLVITSPEKRCGKTLVLASISTVLRKTNAPTRNALKSGCQAALMQKPLVISSTYLRQHRIL